MISIGTDLFQTIALALMFVILIALIALLAAVNGLKKSLGPGARRAEPTTTAYGDTTGYAGYGTPSAAETSYGYGTPGAAQPAATQGAAAQPAATTARPEVTTGYVPLSEASQPAATAAAPAAAAAPTLTGTEPEEQPFERDGRWWFKRGGELLVYDEGTGQWVPAGSASGVATPATGDYGAATTTGDPGEGWRCSSCGAINGSTATVCRMCFTPR